MKSDRVAGPGAVAARAHEMFGGAAVGIARLDPDGCFADANSRLVAILGRSVEALAELRWEAITHPQDLRRVEALLCELRSGERAEVSVEQRVLRPDGTWLWVSLAASPLRDDDGLVSSLVVCVQDITARRLEDEAMRRSELRFRRMIEKLPAAAYTIDREGLITYHNDRAVLLWGRAPQLNHPDDRYCGSFRLFHGDGSPLAHEHCWMVRALHDGKDYHGREVLIERPDGSRVTVLAHASPIRNETGEIVGAMNVLVDISDRKRAELMLIGSELRFTQFMEHLHGLAWIKGFDGRYLYINRAAERLYLRPPDQFIGRTDEDIFPAEAAAQFRENDRKVLATGEVCETIELLEQDDGLHHWMVSKFPIPGPDGSSTRVGGIAIDVTDRVRVREILQESDRRQDALLSRLAGELRAPLAPIRRALEQLRDPRTASSEVVAELERRLGELVRLVEEMREAPSAVV
jgi:PAS domain S-box-containing protein